MSNRNAESWPLDTVTQSASRHLAGQIEARIPTLTVLAHPERSRVGERAFLSSLSGGRETCIARGEPSFAQPGERHEQPLADPRISRSPILLKALNPGRGQGFSIRIDGSKTATRVEVDGQLLNGGVDLSWQELEHGVVLCLSHRIALLVHLADPMIESGLPTYGLIGASDAIHGVRSEIAKLASLDVPVLLRGETGTGKELVARALHQAGPRSSGPLVAVNMAAIPQSLAAAELFGAAKGAYTGATRDRRGAFRRADGGTLFLDEIGDTPDEVQALLLRMLESREVLPVGSGRARPVDVRLLTATDLDLESAIEEGRFRSPLLYRVAGYEIHLPTLRDRREDFGRLFYHFLEHELEVVGGRPLGIGEPHGGPWPPAEIVARLAARPWPGNVRQLRNAARQLAILGPQASPAQLVRWLESSGAGRPSGPSNSPPPSSSVVTSATPAPSSRSSPVVKKPGDIDNEELVEALRLSRYRVQDAADRLGISRAAVYKLMERSPDVRKAVDIGREEIEEALEICAGDLAAMVQRLRVSAPALRRRMRQLGFD